MGRSPQTLRCSHNRMIEWLLQWASQHSDQYQDQLQGQAWTQTHKLIRLLDTVEFYLAFNVTENLCSSQIQLLACTEALGLKQCPVFMFIFFNWIKS